MRRFRLLLIVVLFFEIAEAQLPGTSVWLTLQLPVSFSKKWQWYNDASYRTMGIATTAYQRYYRTGIRYQFSEKWSAINGISFFSTRAKADIHDSEFGKEFRIWQELSYQQKLRKNFSVQHRFRLEERFLEATTLKAAYHILNINNRFTVQKKISQNWNIQIGDEYYEQIIDKQFKFNQNRLSGSGTYSVNKTTQLQGTYMWVLRKASSQQVLQLTIRKMILLYGRNDHS